MVWADRQGNIFEQPGYHAAGRRGHEVLPLEPGELIPLPEGSELFLLPGRHPLGFRTGGRIEAFTGDGEAQAVAAFLPPAYTQYLLPAWSRLADAPLLPLYAYTAVAFLEEGFAVPAVRVDPDLRQEPAGFSCDAVEAGIREFLAACPANRLIRHLSRCAREYFCPAARNYFLGRHEAPLPASPSCNARCVGCISLQPSGCCPATQARIEFVPAPQELAEVALGHFSRVPAGVASFGQGCEGEPLLVADTLEEAARLIRARSGQGTLNLNTNASRPAAVPRLAAAGLDAIRVSLNSARPELYETYYRPTDYGFAQVRESLMAASGAGLYTCLNYFVFPGVTDQPDEVEAVSRLIGETGVRMIQWRNLNIDPDLYLASVPAPPGSLGIARAMDIVRKRFPELRHGYFNPAVRTPTATDTGGTEHDRQGTD